MIERLVRIRSARALVGPVAVVVLCILLVWGTAGCSSPDDDLAWQDDPLGTYREHRAEVESGHTPVRDPSPVGAWVIARGAALDAGLDLEESAAAAHYARWEGRLPCWSERDSAAYGGGLPVCRGGDR